MTVIPDLSALPGLARPYLYRGLAYMAVFDGHDGDACATFLQHELHTVLARHPDFHSDARTATVAAFREVDEAVCAHLRSCEDASGSTALVAVFDGRARRLLVAHAGDSRCVLSCSGGCAIPLTNDHRLTRADERARIAAAGGLIVNHRLNGTLAVSRSFGDFQHKPASGPPTVTATPEVTIRTLDEEDEFALLASDGLWDALSMQQAVNFVRRQLSDHCDMQKATTALTAEAIRRGSVDNVSVIIVALHQDHDNTNQANDADARRPQHK